MNLLSGDFNGDGKADLVGALDTSHNSILLGNGDGTFQESVIASPTIDGLTMVADVNGDGKLDLIVPGANSIDVALGNGDGTFQAPLSSVSNVATFATAVADFNGDGKVDILSVTSSGQVNVVIGNGDGTFQPGVALFQGTAYGVVAIGEFNGDGVTDLAFQTGTAITSLLGYLSSTVSISASANPAVAGDSLTLSAAVSPTPASGTVTFLDGITSLGAATLIDGAGSISGLMLAAGTHYLTATYSGDATFEPASSGVLLETVTGSASSTSLSVSPSPATYGQVVTLTASVDSQNGPVTFYDGPCILGEAALVNGVATFKTSLLNSGLHSLYARFDGGTLTGQSVSPTVPESVNAIAGDHLTESSEPFLYFQSVTAGDFNNDGRADLAYIDEGSLYVALGQGNGTFFSSVDASQVAQFGSITAGDLNGDGNLDLVSLKYQTGAVLVLLGNGDGTFATPVSYGLVPGAASAVITDFNADGKADVAVVGQTGLWVFLGAGDGSLSAPALIDAEPNAKEVQTLDANGDGFPDLAITSSNGLAFYLGNGNGTFRPAVFYLDNQVTKIAVADLNNDGKQDLVVGTMFGADPTWVLLGNGDGTFRVLPKALAAAGNISISDLNGDGKPDLVLSFLGGPASTALGNGDGTFQPPVVFGPSTSIGSIAQTVIADFNGDGRPDIASAEGIYLGAGPACSLSVAPAALYFDANGGTQTVTVTTSDPACAFGAALNLFTLPSGQTGGGTGNTQLQVTAPETSNGTEKLGTLQVGGSTVTLVQDATVQAFNDVPPSAYYFDAVDNLKQQGITAGCSATDYCPTQAVTRADMAIFVVRAMFGSDNFSYSPAPYFTDVPSGAFGFQWIQKFFELGITVGCGSNRFCPDNIVTRDQMAIFLIRARYGASTQFDFPSAPYFTDVQPGSFAFSSIQRLREDNITAGCALTLYCPENSVTRGDMALFVMRGLFNQFLPANTPLITNVSPGTLANGTSITTTIWASGTDFIQGVTVVNAVTGLIFGPATVTSPTTLSVNVTAVAPGAIPQPASIWVTTGSQEAVLPNRISIQ